MTPPTAIVQVCRSGELRFAVHGEGVRLLVVDERAPGDRLFEVTARIDAAELAALVPPDAPIGRDGDGSAEDALAGLILAAAPRPRVRLRVIEGGRT